MENKYYTPKIEEFCVGFEYEFKWKPIKGEWKALENRHPEDLIESIENFYNKEYRVKYLDKKDIESLGFEESHFSNNSKIWLYKDSVCIYYNTESHEIQISKSILTLFRGIIKNKTEFKKLLIQLEII